MTRILLPNLALPSLTNAPHHTKYPNGLACVGAYQRLPDPVLAMLKHMVDLDWSTNTYQASDLGQNLPSGTFTSHRRREGDITHSDWTMCYVML